MWYIIRTPPWYVDNTYIRILYTLHQNEDIFYCGADFYCRTVFFSTLKPRLAEHTADVYCCTDFYCGTDGTVLWGGMYQLETRFARIITIQVLVVRTPVSSLSFQVQHTCYIRPGQHAHEPGTSSASCCCNGSVG